jgi:hypothetical protein
MLSYPTQRRKDRIAIRTPVDPKEVGMVRARLKVIGSQQSIAHVLRQMPKVA